MQRTILKGDFSKIIDCEKIVNQFKSKPGHIKSPINPYGSGVEFNNDQEKENLEMYNNWKRWGYIDNNSIEWINYYPDVDFASSDLDSILSVLKVTPKHIWVSSIRPGKCIPWHRDIESQEKQWAEEGELVRYTVFLNNPEPGQFFVVNDQCFHMIEQGSVYKWLKWDDYHLGSNTGTTQKYLLHIIGLQN